MIVKWNHDTRNVLVKQNLVEMNVHSPEWIVFLDVFWKAIEYASMTRKTRASSSYVGWAFFVDNSYLSWEPDWLFDE